MSSEQQSNAAASPSPTPSPTPHFVPIDELKRRSAASPPPPVIRSLGAFEWNELNRANEILKFFDNAITVFLKRSYIDPKFIALLRISLATKLSETVVRKFQMTSTPVNLETAIAIIDEQLPKLREKAGGTLNVDEFTKMWNIAKEFFKALTGE